MIRTPARSNRAKRPVFLTESIPFPHGGWNARDPLSEMKNTDAIILDNIFPDVGRGSLRKGRTEHATGLSGPVETLMEFSSGTTDKFFAASNGNIYDVTASGAVGAAVQSSKSNARWQHIVFGSAGTPYLYLVNGADAPIHFNGTTWAAPSITGTSFTPADMVHINEFKERVFMVEKDSLNFWYNNTVNAVAGTMVKFPLESFCSKGGFLMAMATWSIDGGSGIDDFAVFLTNKGQAVIYQGTDPGVAATWALVGVFDIGQPIGRRCFMKLGGDLIVVTEDGFLPLSVNLINGTSNKKLAVSDKIRGAVSLAAQSYKDNFGWQPILYPRGNMAVFNIPIISGSEAHQYIMNTTTGAWCRFKNWNGNCFGLYDGDLYMGGSTKVFKVNTTNSDISGNIQGDLKTAFNYFRHRGLNKQFKMLRPIINSNGIINAALGINVDFEDVDPTAIPTFSGIGGSAWDVSDWDVSEWSQQGAITKNWQTVHGVGNTAAIRMRIISNALEVGINSFDMIFEKGAPV